MRSFQHQDSEQTLAQGVEEYFAANPGLARGRLTCVAVVATGCSGKTTFARQLASILGTRCFELDSLYWGDGWTLRHDFQSLARPERAGAD